MTEQPPSRTRARKVQPPPPERRRARKRGGPAVKAAMAAGAVAPPPHAGKGRQAERTPDPRKTPGIVTGSEGSVIPKVAWRVQCHYVNPDTQERCNKLAIRGGYRCELKAHGHTPARAAAARERLVAAQNRLLEMVPGAMERLEKIITEGSDEFALKASLGVLDRIGLGPKASLDVSGHVVIESPAKVLAERLNDMHTRREQAEAALAGAPPEDITDAEVVEEVPDEADSDGAPSPG